MVTGPLRILLIEDDPTDASLIEMTLQRNDIEAEVLRVETAQELTRELETERWQLILCDFSLPRFNGLAALEIVREQAPEIPFILVSGKIGEEATVQVLRAGADDFVTKDELKRLPGAIERTLRRRAELRARALAEASEQRLVRMLEHSPEVAAIATEQGRILYVNAAGRALIGTDDPNRILNATLDDLVHPADAATWEAARESGGEAWTGSLVLRRADGTGMQTSSILMRHLGQGEHYVSLQSHDITDVQQRSHEVELLALVILQMEEGVLVTDADGTIVYTNPAAERLTGYATNDLVGQNPRMLNSGGLDAGHYGELWRTISGGHTWYGRLENRRADGTTYVIDSTITPLLDAEGRITNHVSVFRAVNEAEDEAAPTGAARRLAIMGRVLSSTTDELASVLTAMRGHAGELRTGVVGPLVEEAEALVSAGERASELVQRIRHVAPKTATGAELMGLGAEVQRLRPKLERALAGAGLAVIDESAEAEVRMGRAELEQLVVPMVQLVGEDLNGSGQLDLGLSAVELTAAEAGRLALPRAGSMVRMELKTSGGGMARDTLLGRFQPETDGGLGLPAVVTIIRQHGGSLEADSGPGRGIHLVVHLPRAGGLEAASSTPSGGDATAIDRARVAVEMAATAKASAPAARAAAAPAPADGSPIKVLYVEDEEALRGFTSRLLERHGFEVHHHGNGAVALEWLEGADEAPEVLLTDVVMPRLGGWELAEAVHERLPGLPVVFTSGFPSSQLDDAIDAHPALRFLPKPYDGASLVAAIREAVGR